MSNESSINGSYSFLDVTVAIQGPNVSGSLSEGGFANEGVTIRRVAETDTMTIGAGGAGMHSLSGNQGARIEMTLLKTGPGNAILQQAYNADRVSSGVWGQNTITVTNTISGDSTIAQNCAFAKDADLGYTEAGAANIWTFNSTLCVKHLGSSTP